MHDICETKYFSTNGTPVILKTNCHITEIMNPYLFYQSRGRLDHNRCAGKICKLSCNTKNGLLSVRTKVIPAIENKGGLNNNNYFYNM